MVDGLIQLAKASPDLPGCARRNIQQELRACACERERAREQEHELERERESERASERERERERENPKSGNMYLRRFLRFWINFQPPRKVACDEIVSP